MSVFYTTGLPNIPAVPLMIIEGDVVLDREWEVVRYDNRHSPLAEQASYFPTVYALQAVQVIMHKTGDRKKWWQAGPGPSPFEQQRRILGEATLSVPAVALPPSERIVQGPLGGIRDFRTQYEPVEGAHYEAEPMGAVMAFHDPRKITAEVLFAAAERIVAQLDLQNEKEAAEQRLLGTYPPKTLADLPLEAS